MMNKCLFIVTLIVNTLALSACKDAVNSRQKAESEQAISSLEYLQDLTPQQVSAIVGFGNQKMLLKEQNSAEVYSYSEKNRTPVLLSAEIAPQGKVTACQDFNHQQINWYRLPDINQGDPDKQKLSVISVLCGNINAELTPEIFVLTRADTQLTLFLASPDNLHAFGQWRHITSITAEAKGQYSLLPDFSHHSAVNLQIAQHKHGAWQQIKTLYPGDFITPFDYQPEDHNEIWMAYLNLDRASAKLMWNAGAKSIGKLNTYFDSVNPGLTADVGKQRHKLEALLYRLDPNGKHQVAQRLTDTFIHWKAPTTAP